MTHINNTKCFEIYNDINIKLKELIGSGNFGKQSMLQQIIQVCIKSDGTPTSKYIYKRSKYHKKNV